MNKFVTSILVVVLLPCLMSAHAGRIDDIIRRDLARKRLKPAEPCSDAVFTVRFKLGHKKFLKNMQLQLDDPPAGLTVDGDIRLISEGFEFDLKASDEAQAGFIGNLIVGMYRLPKEVKGKPTKKQKRPWLTGHLPSLPVEISAAENTGM